MDSLSFDMAVVVAGGTRRTLGTRSQPHRRQRRTPELPHGDSIIAKAASTDASPAHRSDSLTDALSLRQLVSNSKVASWAMRSSGCQRTSSRVATQWPVKVRPGLDGVKVSCPVTGLTATWPDDS